MQFSSASCYFFSLSSKYSTYCFSSTLNLLFFSWIERLFCILTKRYFLLTAALYLFQQDKLLTITEPNSLHMLWLIPQYFVITMGEVLFSVTGLEFSFTQVMHVMVIIVYFTASAFRFMSVSCEYASDHLICESGEYQLYYLSFRLKAEYTKVFTVFSGH
jgi:dipeptide/tripeptide permease